MPLPRISPLDAQRLVSKGARVIDIRAADEFARSHIAGATNRPLDGLRAIDGTGPVIFTCRSGMRTATNVGRLANACVEGYLLEGGLDGWRGAGLPIEIDRARPIEIMRQVQIAAGTLVLIGVLLGLAVAPGWFALSAFVGAGLVFAGTTGWCGMASLLTLMPWNRAQQAPSPG